MFYSLSKSCIKYISEPAASNWSIRPFTERSLFFRGSRNVSLRWKPGANCLILLTRWSLENIVAEGKLKPLPRATPRHLNFWKLVCSNSRPVPKSRSCFDLQKLFLKASRSQSRNPVLEKLLNSPKTGKTQARIIFRQTQGKSRFKISTPGVRYMVYGQTPGVFPGWGMLKRYKLNNNKQKTHFTA